MFELYTKALKWPNPLDCMLNFHNTGRTGIEVGCMLSCDKKLSCFHSFQSPRQGTHTNSRCECLYGVQQSTRCFMLFVTQTSCDKSEILRKLEMIDFHKGI
jgi:hypothetical protein